MSAEPETQGVEGPEAAGKGSADGDNLKRAISGDVGGFNRLVAQHWAAVASYASKVLGVGPRSGEDIAQEVFLKLWAGDIRWSGEGSSRAFLLGVTRNLCLNRRRKESLRKRLSDKVRTQFQLWQRMPNPGEDLQASELQRRLDVVLESMPARRREVFLLIRMQGLSYAEVAEIMGISAQTVANQMTLALKQLRQAL